MVHHVVRSRKVWRLALYALCAGTFLFIYLARVRSLRQARPVDVRLESFWRGFDLKSSSLVQILSEGCPTCRFALDSPNARVVVSSVSGTPQLKHNMSTSAHTPVRILYVLENLRVPQYRRWLQLVNRTGRDAYFDFVIGCVPKRDNSAIRDNSDGWQARHALARPWMAFSAPWVERLSSEEEQFIKRHSVPDATLYLARQRSVAMVSRSDLGGFRSMLVENLEALPELSRVDTPSALHKNWPSVEAQGLTNVQFLSKYLFVVAPENSLAPGYVTEKLMAVALSGAIPIYAGSEIPPEPSIFNKQRMILIRTMDKDGVSEACKTVQRLLRNQTLLREMFEKPIFARTAMHTIRLYRRHLRMAMRKAIQLSGSSPGPLRDFDG